MTKETGKLAGIWERGLAPLGFLLLLVTLFLAQLSLTDTATKADHPLRTAANGGVAPSPLSTSDDLWLPAGSHAERRIAKAKTGLPEGDGTGKLFLPASGLVLYPLGRATLDVTPAMADAAPAGARTCAFQSRAPPSPTA